MCQLSKIQVREHAVGTASAEMAGHIEGWGRQWAAVWSNPNHGGAGDQPNVQHLSNISVCSS